MAKWLVAREVAWLADQEVPNRVVPAVAWVQGPVVSREPRVAGILYLAAGLVEEEGRSSGRVVF